MKKFIKTALLFTLTATNVFALQMTVIPFIGYATYDDKSKETDFQTGVYTSINGSKNTLEVAYEYKDTSYLTTQDNTKQNDLTFLYTYSKTKYFKIRGAIHYISSSLEKDNNTLISLVGIENRNKKFTIGINVSQSKYNDNALTNYMNQVTPYFAFSFGDINSLMGRYYTKISYDGIYPSQTNQTLKNLYSSFTMGITQNKGNMENTFRLWRGEQLYSVRNNALTVYNLDDIHSGGIILSSKYKYSKKSNIKLSYINEYFTSFDASTKSKMNRYLLSLNFHF